jgi:hypothetical protein
VLQMKRIQGDKTNMKIHHFLTITDYNPWPRVFCLHLDGEEGAGAGLCKSLDVLIQHVLYALFSNAVAMVDFLSLTVVKPSSVMLTFLMDLPFFALKNSATASLMLYPTNFKPAQLARVVLWRMTMLVLLLLRRHLDSYPLCE